jgi:hypothetical protein
MTSTSLSAMMAANRRFLTRHHHTVEATHRRAVRNGVREPVMVLVDLADPAARYLAACLGVSRRVIRRRLLSAWRDRKEAPLVLASPLPEIAPVLRREAPGAAQWLVPPTWPNCHLILVAGRSGVSVALLATPEEARPADRGE